MSAIEAEMEVEDIAGLVWEQIKANNAKIEAMKASPAIANEPALEPADA